MQVTLEPPVEGASARLPQTRCLGRAVWCEAWGEGYISFESTDSVTEARILHASFASKTLCGCLAVLAEHGVCWDDTEAYGVATAYPLTLSGHAGASGFALDEGHIRLALQAHELRAA